jgi:hypothetical protein
MKESVEIPDMQKPDLKNSVVLTQQCKRGRLDAPVGSSNRGSKREAESLNQGEAQDSGAMPI